MKFTNLRCSLLVTVPLWIGAAPLLRADVTVRYKSDMKLNAPMQAGDKAEKSIQDFLSRFSNISVRMKNGKSWSNIGSFTAIVDYNTQQMILIDTEHKTFAKLPVAELPDKMPALMPKPPDEAKKAMQSEEMKKMMEGIKSNVASKKTGRSETIQGIQAEERETVLSIEMPMPAGAPMSSMSMKMVMQTWTATSEETLRNQAVREFTGYSQWANYFMNSSGMMQKMMGNMPGSGDWLKSLNDELSAARGNAMMLRNRTEMSMQLPPEVRKMMAGKSAADPDAPLFVMTQDAVEVSTAPVEESIFQVPADYQAAPADDLLKNMMAQMTALGGMSK